MVRPGLRRTPKGPLPRNIYRRDGAAPRRGEPARRLPTPEQMCLVKARCGACKYVNLDYVTSLDDKVQGGLKLLQSAGVMGNARVLPAAASPRTLEYRSLFKLAVRPTTAGESGRFAIGLFAVGSHDLVPMDNCPLHTTPLRRLIHDLKSELDASPLTPYDESTHTGQVRYVAARSAHVTGELMLTFVMTEAMKPELRRIVEALQRREHKINSAHMNLNLPRGNAIFGPETIRVAGAARLRERVCDLDFEIGPTSFFQINPWQAVNLYRRLEQIAGPARSGEVAWDLYCGTGQISLVLARQGYKVFGIEENPQAVTDAGENARRNHLEDRTTFLASRVEDAQAQVPTWAASPSLIVVNPSRRGLAESTRKHLTLLLAAHPQARFVYVSCSVETLSRDLKELTQSGFQVRQVEPYDMFAQTDNMEWLVVMSRPGAP